MDEQTKELEKRIKAVKEKVQEIFNYDVIANFDSKLQSDLKEINCTFADPLIEQLDNCDRLMKAPVYVGMLGRYSHGKSALVNSLFLMDEDTKLPEGESVVTSKVTRVSFDDSISYATAYKYYNGSNDREQFAEYADFQNTAQSKDDDNSSIAFLEANIPIGEKRNLARDFFQNNIQLIDMPGLGGPYYDDSKMTRAYVNDMDLVVVAIKITEIEESAAAVNKFLQKVNCPKIAVLTFYDLAADHNLFADCNKDMAKIIAKAKNEVDKYFTNLGDSDDIIVVSNKDNALVDKVRERILQKITVQIIATKTTKQEIPVVQKRKANALKKELESLNQKALALPKRLEAIIEESIGKDEEATINICSIFDTAKIRNKQKKRKTDIDKAINSFKREQNSVINSILSVDECDSVCQRIGKESSLLLKNVSDSFEDYKAELRDVADEFISDLHISENEKKEYKKTVKEILNNHSDLFKEIVFDVQSVKRAATIQKAKSWARNLWNRITGKAKDNKNKAKEAMKNALGDALSKFADDISQKIENTDVAIKNEFNNEINMEKLNEDVKDLVARKNSVSRKIDELREAIETVKYKI